MKTKEQHRKNNLQYYHDRRNKLIQQLGGKCAKCGSTEHLEFDHIDSSNKEISISRNITKNIDTIQNELSKCQLLCHSCHIKKSRENKDGNEKISKDIAEKIKEEYSHSNITQTELGKKYGLKQREVSYIVSNKRWS